jgi:hypothetical protein
MIHQRIGIQSLLPEHDNAPGIRIFSDELPSPAQQGQSEITAAPVTANEYRDGRFMHGSMMFVMGKFVNFS